MKPLPLWTLLKDPSATPLGEESYLWKWKKMIYPPLRKMKSIWRRKRRMPGGAKKNKRKRTCKKKKLKIRVEKVEAIVNFAINEAAMKKLRNPWWETLIIKLLGRKISLMALTRRLDAMWSKMGSIDVIDIGNDFFIVKFYSQEDLDFALTEGPWKIFDHYLSIRQWKSDFNPIEATIDQIVAWVRLPRLAIEYYDGNMLKKIGDVIGRTLKVDTNTAEKSREKFARLCVQLDLHQALISQYSINGVRYKVEYEGLYNICFGCGMVGHEKSACPKVSRTEANREVANGKKESVVGGGEGHNQEISTPRNEESSVEIIEKDKGKQVMIEESDNYGPWMVVQRPTRGRRTGKGEASGSGEGSNGMNGRATVTGTRYDVLQEKKNEENQDKNNGEKSHPEKNLVVSATQAVKQDYNNQKH
nr:uncharacterized protein LOC112709433 [Arachis hypogaea]